METIAAPGARRLLWLGFALALPFPFMVLELGLAPPLRMFFLGSLVLGFFASAPQAMTGLLTALLFGQGLVWVFACRWLAGLVTRRLGDGDGIARGRVFAALGVLAAAALLPIYVLPFSSGDLQTNWLGLFR